MTLALPFDLTLEHWPDSGISLSYGPLTLALPVPARRRLKRKTPPPTNASAVDDQQYKPRPRAVRPDFPAWNLYPAGRWNYALCVDEQSLPRLAQVEWQAPSAITPFDPAQPFVTMRLPARMVEGWDLDQRPNGVSQENNWVVNGQWRHGKRRKVEGRFTFTPPLPLIQRPARLPGPGNRVDRVGAVRLHPTAPDGFPTGEGIIKFTFFIREKRSFSRIKKSDFPYLSDSFL